MNKKELIERIEGLKNIFGNECEYVKIDFVIELASELDEPEKVKVPQFVAEWYEKHKDNLEYDIWEYILHWGKQQKSEFYEWMNYASNKPFQTLANMHQFGYEVEKEKRYIVKFKGFNPSYIILKYHSYDKTWFLGGEQEYEFYRTKHTRKELEEAGFGWVFDCPGIKVREVEE